jgi:hypothetical protein
MLAIRLSNQCMGLTRLLVPITGYNFPEVSSVEGCDRIAKALGVPICDLFAFNNPLPQLPKKKIKHKTKRVRGRPRLDL